MVNPKPTCVWTKDNLIFRSSIWNSQGELISCGFKKFFNFTEQPDLYPSILSSENIIFVEKCDGSLLSISKYKGQLIHRTRGTFDASKMENGFEIEILKQKYPKAFDFGDEQTSRYSFIYEWVTPNNRIILDYKELDIYLIGIIDHEDYSMSQQLELNMIAVCLGVKRPKTYYFKSLNEATEEIKNWKDKEGVCAYFNRDQNIVKIKGEHYLKLHYMMSKLASVKRVLEVWFEIGKPPHQKFFDYIATNFDYEIARYHKANIFKVCETYDYFINEHLRAHNIVKEKRLKEMSRKEAASIINSIKDETSMFKSLCFLSLDGKDASDIQIKKIMEDKLL